jgi:repressor LexA
MLTDAQERVLTFIREYRIEKGFPPTRAEIARAMGFKSPNAAEEHLRALARKGAVRITPSVARGITVL